MQKFSEYLHPSDTIVAIMQRLYDGGMTTTSGGNLSIPDSDGNVWISPGSIDKGSLKRTDIVCITPEGKFVGIHKPSSEHPFHRAVYKMIPKARALLHAHPPALVSFSVAKRVPNTKLYPVADAVCGKIGFAPYDVPGSDALGQKVAAEFVKGYSSILLENHGTCIIGDSLLDAFQRFETLDFCARIELLANRLGGAKALNEAELELSRVNRNGKFKAVPAGVRSSKETELRYQLANLARRAVRQQLCTSLTGTFAARVDAESFLITRKKADRGTLDIEDFALVSGNTFEAGSPVDDEAWFIQSLFAAQPDVNMVIFAQPPHLMGYAVSHEKFDPRVIPESYILLREMPAFEFSTFYRDPGKVQATLSPRYPVVMLQNLGVLSVGKAPLEAFDRLEVAEYSAKATVSARELGGMQPIVGKQIDDLVAAFHLIP